jgi:hypothetical protein
LFAFRDNTVVLLPLLIVLICRRFASRVHRAVAIAMLFSALGLAYAADARDRSNIEVSAPIFAWETVGTLKVLQEEGITELLEIPHVGNFTGAISHLSWDELGTLFWSAQPPLDLVKIVGSRRAVLRAFRDLVVRHPLAYVTAKGTIYASLLGFHTIRTEAMYEMKELPPFEPAYLREELVQRGGYAVATLATPGTFGRGMAILYCPAAWLLASLWVYARQLRGKRKDPDTLVLLYLAWMAYGAYFLLTPSFDFRYFFPSCVLIIVAITRSLCAPAAEAVTVQTGREQP